MSHLQPPVRLGQTVGDGFRLDEIIGHGGMGVVVRATHGALGLSVAIKFMRRDACLDPEHVRRFVQEADLLAQLATDHVPQVVELSRLPSGEPYLVMELLDGEDLGQRLSESALDPHQAVDIVSQACRGLAEAHRQGIVHRDIKPENLFLTGEPGRLVVKLLDFGCSKQPRRCSQSERGTAVVTEPGIGLGTAAYMAPEQWRSARDVDARADIWSLGVILYELLADSHPFQADCVGQLMLKIGRGEVTPLAELRPDLPRQLTDLVHRCLEVDPDDRPATVEILLATLQAVTLPNPVAQDRAARTVVSAGPCRPCRLSSQSTEIAPDTWIPDSRVTALRSAVGPPS
ncbi:MAG: serine/threonine protein kinase [Deltaproteobacteria bacterium]|nr:MAG: serine/threonine protein kinase [Deltaproteobacteria bacterium]